MHTSQSKDQFIELCGQGLSVEVVARQLNISRSTAFNWSRQFQARIHNLKAMRLNAARESILGPYEQRLKTAVTRLHKYEQEMESRDPKYMDMQELQDLIDDARKEVEKLALLPTLVDEPEEPVDTPERTS